MYLNHRYTLLQRMHVSGRKTQKTFRDYIKLSSEKIADEIAAIVNGAKKKCSDKQSICIYLKIKKKY